MKSCSSLMVKVIVASVLVIFTSVLRGQTNQPVPPQADPATRIDDMLSTIRQESLTRSHAARAAYRQAIINSLIAEPLDLNLKTIKIVQGEKQYKQSEKDALVELIQKYSTTPPILSAKSKLTTTVTSDNTNAPVAGKPEKSEAPSTTSSTVPAAPATNSVPTANLNTETKQTSVSSLFHHLTVSTGAKFVSPYTITVAPPNAPLTKSGNSTSPFLEFSGYNRFVLNLSTNKNDRDVARSQAILGKMEADDRNWLVPGLHVPDTEVHVGFVFNNQNTPSNYSATTIAGGGDYYASGAVGFPVYRYTSLDDLTSQQLTIEVAGGATTDKNFLAVHPNLFLGGGWQWRFASSTGGYGYLAARAGYGWIDIPKFDSQARTNVDLNGNLPIFTLRGSPTVGTFIAYPVGNVFVNLGGNLYFRDSPAPWDISAGVTVPLDSIVKVLGVTTEK